jgi:hypothetical protein
MVDSPRRVGRVAALVGLFLSAAVGSVALAGPATVERTLEFAVEDRALFPLSRDAEVVPIGDTIEVGTGGPVTVGEIRRIPQDIPVEVLQAAWDQALAQCRTTRSRKIVNYCASYSFTPSQAQCETGQVTLPSSVTINCCTNFGIIDTDVSYPTCATGFFDVPGKANFSVTVPSGLRSFSIGAGIGPRPTEPAPADFDVGMRVTYQADVSAGVELEIAQNDGGLLDVAYHTRATLQADAAEVPVGEAFTLEAWHTPIVGATGANSAPGERRSFMSSEYPAVGAQLRYYLDADIRATAEYAYLDQTTGQQVHAQSPIVDFRTADLPLTHIDDQGRLIGELFGLRLGLFEGLELRLMRDVPYLPDELAELVGAGYTLQIPPIAAGATLPVEITWPFRCPQTILYSLLGELTPQEEIDACNLASQSLFVIDLALAALQKPALETPAADDFTGGVVGFASVEPVAISRNELDPASGALINTTPSAFRPALNFTPGDPVDIEDFLGDPSKLSTDYARFEIDLDGLASLASGQGSTGLSIFGTTLDVPFVFELELNSWDSDLVLWLAYDQVLTFEPNLVVDLTFDKPVEVRPADSTAPYQMLPAGQSVTIQMGAFSAGPGTGLSVIQPAGGVRITPVFSIRNNRFHNKVLPTTTFAWDNTFLQASLGGSLGTIMSAAGFPFPTDFALLRTALAAPPGRGQDIGDPERPLTGLGFADVPGQDLVVSALPPLDADGDGFVNRLDNCPFFAQQSLLDSDGDGRGDECECGDQNGDGHNSVEDLVAIHLALFAPGLATPLCDGNGDGRCDVADLVAANRELFSPKTSTCGRQPIPGP